MFAIKNVVSGQFVTYSTDRDSLEKYLLIIDTAPPSHEIVELYPPALETAEAIPSSPETVENPDATA
jgi:hypothetical protein